MRIKDLSEDTRPGENEPMEYSHSLPSTETCHGWSGLSAPVGQASMHWPQRSHRGGPA